MVWFSIGKKEWSLEYFIEGKGNHYWLKIADEDGNQVIFDPSLRKIVGDYEGYIENTAIFGVSDITINLGSTYKPAMLMDNGDVVFDSTLTYLPIDKTTDLCYTGLF